MLFNALEERVDRFIGVLSGLDGADLQCFTNQMDLLKKLPTLKALALKRKPSDQWFSDVELMLWATETKIIPGRNRYVHDIWLALPDGPLRVYERVSIKKTQAFKPLELTTEERVSCTAQEIWGHAQKTKDVANILRHLTAAFVSGRAKSEPEKVFPQQYRDQWLALRKPPQEVRSTKRGRRAR
jgi:hypothetical protein